MTQKEKLYVEYIDICNKIAELRGEKLMDNSEEYFNSKEFNIVASRYTKEYWRNSIENKKVKYIDEVKRLRVGNYYNSDEGKVVKANLEKRIEEVIENRKHLVLLTSSKIDTKIKSVLGTQWGVHLYNNSLEIGIVDKVIERDNYELNIFHFGLDFEITFENSLYGEKRGNNKRFDLNYGSMGAFNPLEPDNLRSQFLIGLGKFVNDLDLMNGIKNILTSYTNNLSNIEKDYDILKSRLADPFKVMY